MALERSIIINDWEPLDTFLLQHYKDTSVLELPLLDAVDYYREAVEVKEDDRLYTTWNSIYFNGMGGGEFKSFAEFKDSMKSEARLEMERVEREQALGQSIDTILPQMGKISGEI